MAKGQVIVLERPTLGRMLFYSYASSDHPHPELVGDVRPATVTHVYPDAPPDAEGVRHRQVDLVVSTRGRKDFLVGREGSEGTLVVHGVLLVAEPATGACHWPERKP